MYFPKLLESPIVPEEDKRKIAELLKKPWNPHFRRHTTVTEISKRLKDPVLINKYFRWPQRGNTRLRYQHYGSNDAIEELNRLDGLLPVADDIAKRDLLKPIICPNCDESNKPESKFCMKCKFVLTWDAYNQVNQETEQREKELQDTKKELEDLKARLIDSMKIEAVAEQAKADREEIKAQVAELTVARDKAERSQQEEIARLREYLGSVERALKKSGLIGKQHKAADRNKIWHTIDADKALDPAYLQSLIGLRQNIVIKPLKKKEKQQKQKAIK